MEKEDMTYKEWIDSMEENIPYYNPASLREGNVVTEERFPIVASDVRYDNDGKVLPKEDLQAIKDANFTIGMQPSVSDDDDAQLHSLAFASQVDIKVIFTTGALFNSDKYDKYIKETIKYYAGIYVMDEPKYIDLIDQNRGEKSNYYTIINKFKDLKNFIAYINLNGYPVKGVLPSECENSSDREGCYQKYLDAYQENYKPAFFCYDLYPISEGNHLILEGIRNDINGKKEGLIYVNIDEFYNRFDMYSKFAKKHNRPFWAFCESNYYMNLKDGSSFRGVALEQYLRYEAFSALAYGAKGIVYWTYAAQPTVINEDGSETRFSALTNRKHQKTASWYYAQKVNAEIRKYQDIFLHADLKEVINKQEYLYMTSRAVVRIRTDITNGTVISRFENGRDTFIMVVSRYPLNYFNLTIAVVNGTVYELTPARSNGKENTILTGTTRRVMIPGGYRIFQILN